MPEQLLLSHYSGSKYEGLFMGTFWERLQTIETTGRSADYIWWPTKHDHEWVHQLAFIIHQTVHLIDIEDNAEMLFYLHIYYDAHVPLMCALEDSGPEHIRAVFRKYHPKTETVLHEGALPDIISLQLQCSFWNENKPKMQPIVHLMCKALPQRCQIRNLREIISNYCRTDDLVHEFMRSALLCSLLGMYQHNKTRLSWKVRKKIIRRFIYDKPNRMQLQEWLFTTYQHLLFYIIKEFLTYSMRMIPALYEELCNTYKWNTFETTVWSAMDLVRKTVQVNVLQHSTIQDWLSQIESNLMQVNKQQLGNLYRPQRLTFTQNVIAMCDRIDEQRHQVKPHVEFPAEYRLLLRHMVKRVNRGDPHIDWLKFFNVSQKSIDALVNMYQHYKQNTYRSDLRKLLNASPRYEFEAIRELFFSFEQNHRDIRVFTLPEHYYTRQVKALQRRYGLSPDEELLPHVGEVYVCLSCSTFKGFIVKKDAKCSNLFANGHHKIIVDDETLKCYCGRRCEKTDTKKRKRIAVDTFLDSGELEEHRKRRIKKDWKTRRKKMQNELCASTECIKFNMTGCLFQFHNKLYLFCPSCGNPTCFNHDQIDKHGLTCGECLKEGTLYTTVKCYICNTFRGKDSWTTIQTEDDDKKMDTLAICNTCYKPWLRQYEQPIPKNIIDQQKLKLDK
tara:strand:+ start:2991 stop:5006 length:2016 start_codon:yes stop_codon:yes gene_type:complete